MDKRIKELRKLLNLTLEEFGSRIGISAVSVSKFERNINNPSNQTIMSIVKEFGVDEQWLRTGEGEMFPPKNEYDTMAELVNKMLRNKDDKERLFITDFLYNHMSDEEVHFIMDKMIEFVDSLKEKDEPQS